MKAALLLKLARVFGRLGSHAPLKVLVATLVVLVLSATGFHYFEGPHQNLTWLDSLWWALVTMTTVGYGDISPTTTLGRYFVAFPTMILGISILGYLMSAVAASLVERHTLARRGLMPVYCENHVVIINYPGEERLSALIRQLRADPTTANRDIVLIDPDLETVPPLFIAEGVKFVQGPPTKESILNRANVSKANYAIVLAQGGPDSDSRALAAIVVLESMHPGIHSVVECASPEHVDLLKRAGADSVVCLASLTANMLVQELMDPGVQDVISQITSNTTGSQLYMSDVESEDTYGALRAMMRRRGVIVLGIKDLSKSTRLNPEDAYKVCRGMQLVCLAEDRARTSLIPGVA